MRAKGILPFLVLPLLLAFAVHVDVGLPLTLVLAFVLILATGVLMDAGPVGSLGFPLVVSAGVAATLFQVMSPDRGPMRPRFVGDRRRFRSEGLV